MKNLITTLLLFVCLINANAQTNLNITSQTVCAGSSVTVTASNPNTSFTFIWTSNSSGSQTGPNLSIPSALNTDIWTCTTYDGLTMVETDPFSLTVNPLPVMTSANVGAVCSNSPLNFVLTANVPSTFSWVAIANSQVVGESITPVSSSTINNTIIVTTSTSQFVVYTATPTSIANSCIGTPQNIQITVNQLPGMTSTNVGSVCSGAPLNFGLSASIPSTFSWVATSNSQVNGESTSPVSSPIINNNLIQTTSSPQIVSYTVTPTTVTGSCIGTPQTVSITVNPMPTLTSTSGTICSGSNVNFTLGANPSSTFTWSAIANSQVNGETTTLSNSTTINDVLFNSNSITEIVTYSVTPTTINGSCVGSSQTVTINVGVNPNAQMTSLNTSSICSGAPLNFGLSANIPSTFSWVATSNSQVNGESTSPVSSSAINNNLTQATSSPQIVSYTVTPITVAGSCIGTPQTVSITVNPLPTMTSANTGSICSGAPLSFGLTSNIASNYSWSAINNPNVTGETTSNSTSSTIGNVLVNSTTGLQTVTYIVTPTSNSSCQGSMQEISITVVSLPILTSTSGTICSGSNVNFALGANPPSNFTWSAIANSQVNGETTILSNSTTINDVLFNSNSITEIVTYLVTPTTINGSCVGSSQTVTINVGVNPNAQMTSLNTSSICSGAPLNFGLSASIPSTFSWVATSNAQVNGESTTPVSSSAINNNLTQTTSSPQIVSYTVTPITVAGSCIGTPQTVSITVNPLPTMTSANTSSICSGVPLNFGLSASIPSTFSWVATSNAQVNGESTTPVSSSAINNNLTQTTSSPQIVSYTVTPITVAGSCIGTPQTVSITVNPLPIMTSANTGMLCSGTQLNFGLSSNITSNYSWSATNNIDVSGETISNSTSTTIGDVLVNLTPSSQIVTYNVIPTSLSSCQGIQQVISITVVPLPMLTSTSGTICSGNNIDFNLVANPTSNFTWFALENTQVNGETTTLMTTSVINDVLVNPNSTSEIITYNVTPTSIIGSCLGSSQTLTININPVPDIPSIFGSESLCLQSLNQVYTSNLSNNLLFWQIQGGSIYSGQYTNEIHVDVNSNDTMWVQLTEQILNTGCSSSNVYYVLIDNNSTAPAYVDVFPLGTQNDFLCAPQANNVFRWGKIDKASNDIYYYVTSDLYFNFIQIDTAQNFYFVDHGQVGCFTRSYYFSPAPISGISEVESIALSIVPNPVTNQFEISSPVNENVHILIQNIEGQIVYEENTLTNSSIVFEDSKPGMYFVKVTNANKSTIIKFLKL